MYQTNVERPTKKIRINFPLNGGNLTSQQTSMSIKCFDNHNATSYKSPNRRHKIKQKTKRKGERTTSSPPRLSFDGNFL